MGVSGRRVRGFTMLELLVVIAVIALILAILLPALSAGRETARDLKCKAGFREVATAFTFFADAGGSGSSQLGENRFLIEDFQESIYGIDDYWDLPNTDTARIDPANQPLMCPSGPYVLERRANMPCSAGAIGPAANVSVAFNKRLEKRTFYFNGSPFPAAAVLTPAILHHPNVPLLMDASGEAAAQANRTPYYTAPPIDDDKDVDIYESGSFWFPSNRHRGKLNVGFIGGHVLSSSNPTAEPWWRWGYQPEP